MLSADEVRRERLLSALRALEARGLMAPGSADHYPRWVMPSAVVAHHEEHLIAMLEFALSLPPGGDAEAVRIMAEVLSEATERLRKRLGRPS